MKNIIFFSALLLLSACGLCRAEGGIALLWIPDASSEWGNVLDSVDKRPDFKLTVAAPPDTTSKDERWKLDKLLSQDRAEVVLRLRGDAVLPVIFSPNNAKVVWEGKPKNPLWTDRLDEAASRLFYVKSRQESLYSKQPSGWAPAAGGIVPEMLPLLKAYEIKWLATGQVQDGDFSVLASSELALVPFKRICSEDDYQALIASATETVVYGVLDETVPCPSGNSVRDLLPAIFEVQTSTGFLTVSQALELSSPTFRSDIERFPLPWTGDYSLWAKSPAQIGAYFGLAQARESFNVYRNSRVFKQQISDEADNEFIELEASERFLRLASTDTVSSQDAELELKGGLNHIYRLIDRPIPPALLRAFSENATVNFNADPQVSAAPVAISGGDSFIVISNAKTISRDTKAEQKNRDELFRLESVKIEWTQSSLRFTVRHSKPDAETISRFSSLATTDIYIDMNNRLRSGSVNLLDGRPIVAAPENAWEFAIMLRNSIVSVYKATPSGNVKVGSYAASLAKNRDVVFTIPREVIKGNPVLWSYLVITLSKSKESPTPGVQGYSLMDTMSLDKIGAAAYFLRLPKRIN